MTLVKFVYQGHRVQVKAMRAKRSHTHSRVVGLR